MRRTRSSKRRLRVLQIRYTFLNADDLNLSAVSELNELVALAKRGHELTFMVPSITSSRVGMKNVSGLTVKTFQLRRKVPFFSVILFQFMVCWSLLGSLGYWDALILDYNEVPLLFPLLILRRLISKRPVLLLRIVTNPLQIENPIRMAVTTIFLALSLKLSATIFDKLYFISPMMGKEYSTLLGIPDDKIDVWPSSVSLELFHPIPQRSPTIRRLRVDLDVTDRLAVIYHGVLSRARGIMETVQAFRLLKDASVRTSLILLGDGPERKEILDFIRSNNLEEFVKVRGPVPYDEVPNYIAACDVGLVALPDHPWWRYQCPTKLLEYLAMLKPVIVSNISAHRWMLGNMPMAIYLHETTPRDIAEAVIAFKRGHEEFDAQLGKKVTSAFSDTSIASMLEEQISSSLK